MEQNLSSIGTLIGEEYPRLSPNEKIKKGCKYSYRYSLYVPYIILETFEASLPLVGGRIEKKFPLLSSLYIYYVIVNSAIPDEIDFAFSFNEEPGFTHSQFSEQIKSIAGETYWNLSLQEFVLLEKPFPWFWLGLLFLVGTLGVKGKKG